jgi:general secretion pathway protein E
VARTGLQVKRALALASNIEEMQNRFFPGRSATVVRDDAAAPTEAQYFQFHLVQALQQGGTEIHFDPAGNGQARVRYRLQGVLVDRPAQPVELHEAILRYLRELTRVADAAPQTSSTTIAVGDKKIMLVATFLPTIAGQAATVTIQALQSDAPDLTGLGVSDEAIRPVREALHGASGVVLVGCDDRWVRATLLHGLIPVGSRGKIWALEAMPVYRRSTINQTLLDPHASLAMPVAAAVDAGADLILVDDVSRRDGLLSALEAGRTRVVLAGHVDSSVVAVLSEALEATGSALVASTLRAVVTARAIRLLCPACKQPVNGDGGAFRGQRTFLPAGCEACGFTGFKGRRLLVDVWLLGQDGRRQLLTGQAHALLGRLLDTASSLRDAGKTLVLDGLTSPDELTRVAG